MAGPERGSSASGDHADLGADGDETHEGTSQMRCEGGCLVAWWGGLACLILVPVIALGVLGMFLPWSSPPRKGCISTDPSGAGVWKGLAYGQDVGDETQSESPSPSPSNASPAAETSPSNASPSAETSPLASAAGSKGTVERTPDEPVALTPVDGKGEVVIPFGQSRGGVPRRVLYKTSEPVHRMDHLAGLYAADVLGIPGGRIPDQNIRYRVEMVRGIVTIRFCVSPLGIAPGEYRGTVYLRDPRFEPREIPLTVTLQYNGWHLVIAVLWLAFMAGALFKWAGAQRALDIVLQSKRVGRDFFVWAGSRFIVLAAAIVAIAGIFATQYLADPQWAPAPDKWFALIGAGFAATVTAVSAGEVAKPTREKGLEDKLGPHPETTQEHDRRRKRRSNRRKEDGDAV